MKATLKETYLDIIKWVQGNCPIWAREDRRYRDWLREVILYISNGDPKNFDWDSWEPGDETFTHPPE